MQWSCSNGLEEELLAFVLVMLGSNLGMIALSWYLIQGSEFIQKGWENFLNSHILWPATALKGYS